MELKRWLGIALTLSTFTRKVFPWLRRCQPWVWPWLRRRHLGFGHDLDLSNNSFSGKIQELKSRTLYVVVLKQNQLQGPIPKSLLDHQGLNYLILSQNNLSGQIASTICHLKTLQVLDLGSNHLNRTITHCLGEMSGFKVLGLNNNSLSGTINTTFNTENQLNIMNLDRDKLKGEVPPSLINCRYLEFLDLGNNELNETFPSWLGGLPNLQILSLRSNKLYGPISDLRKDNFLAKIRVIDLSSNGFSGDLPVSLFKNFQAMKIIGENGGTREYIADDVSAYYTNTLIVTTKGWDREFCHDLKTNIIINFSRNRFEGNDGLRGFPLSKDCGGDDGIPQATTPVELDEEKGDLISWQVVLMGYGCVKQALAVCGDSLSESDDIENPEDASLLAVEDNETSYNSPFAHMDKPEDEGRG
ncbi:hypothetical protein CQW23_01304 [Capsicum baccatum]|uniref:Uncharacterized protein n=1 Tax=Capsicum baccatum TaxID=33114 RepID=A0A2G2XNK9_CAPBA|nr:hypothetical protein CQW23_01304 [Capsicum baccatum]